VTGDKFKTGQLLSYLSRDATSGERSSIGIKNVNEPHERMVKEHELRSAT
jgi:hypothetical protein